MYTVDVLSKVFWRYPLRIFFFNFENLSTPRQTTTLGQVLGQGAERCGQSSQFAVGGGGGGCTQIFKIEKKNSKMILPVFLLIL